MHFQIYPILKLFGDFRNFLVSLSFLIQRKTPFCLITPKKLVKKGKYIQICNF